MISDVQKGPHLAIRYLFTVLKMWNFLKNTQFSTLEQYRLPNFKLGPIVHPRNHLSIWKLDFSFYDHSQILVIKCNHGQKPLWYIKSELTVQGARTLTVPWECVNFLWNKCNTGTIDPNCTLKCAGLLLKVKNLDVFKKKGGVATHSCSKKIDLFRHSNHGAGNRGDHCTLWPGAVWMKDISIYSFTEGTLYNWSKKTRRDWWKQHSAIQHIHFTAFELVNFQVLILSLLQSIKQASKNFLKFWCFKVTNYDAFPNFAIKIFRGRWMWLPYS